ncbi:replication initiator [Glycomyces tritici]|uniref:Replication initiation protein n=1 Tax=Glycomyces tritici TaxID=2665176 RepID=A0ABT7YQD3_9ACTN|nr:replication initiator [Glycomyces tritici]MDN3240853.1 replication initiation protein [Glycomyces tritici]
MVAAQTYATPLTESSLKSFVSSSSFPDWKARVEAVGGCARPVKLFGRLREVDTKTGLVLSREDRSVWVRCGTRREAACPACSARYEADAYHLVRAGLSGDEEKGVPVSVATRPTAFVTLTAPSFGPVHNRPGNRPCVCGAWHLEADTRLGSPVDPATYDYEAAVLWNNHASALWADFTRRLRRALAHAGGLTVREASEVVCLSYAKVAEYQRRGRVHFHAAVRLDGPGGCSAEPPAWATAEVLADAVRVAAVATEVDAERADASPLALRWGTQLDIQAIDTGSADASTSGPAQVAAGKVAAYIAKYATKSTGATNGIDQQVTLADIDALEATAHAKTMMRTALQLADVPHLADLRLDRWAHMLGYRGHFLTKSRAFSTTFAELRARRAAWVLAKNLLDNGLPDVVIDAEWQVIGFGYRTAEEHTIAAAIAQRHQANRARAVAQASATIGTVVSK